jgi:hypothetical protein
MAGWKSQAEYEALHGTQEEQARRQATGRLVVDGPWKLERLVEHNPFGQEHRLCLPGFVCSTSVEARQRAEAEFARTGLVWEMTRL